MTNYELTIKDVNKSNSKFEIRNLKFVIIFIFLITLFGFFGFAEKVDAQGARSYNCFVIYKTAFGGDAFAQPKTTQTICNSEDKTQLAELLELPSARRIVKTIWVPESDPAGVCTATDGDNRTIIATGMPSVLCEYEVMTLKHPEKDLRPKPFNDYVWKSTTETLPSEEQKPAGTKISFEDNINEGCGSFPDWTLDGCVLKFFYYTYFQLPGFVLWVSALFFNALISLVIQSSMYSASFISSAWEVVRDISNIFFILILLYIAIKIILGLGGSETKKMIAYVIIMALLINFSMFFTKIVIDSSNVLALIFYSKVDTKTLEPGQTKPREYTTSTPYKEKDVSGAMYQNFNATKLMTPDFITKLKTTEVNGKTHVSDTLPFALTLGILVISGTIMLWAAYTFFVAGIFFLGRLVELWILMIFSPFAFMSFPIPLLKSIPYIGWDEWLKKLVATSFMAPIFMFFIYLIFRLLQANIFSGFTSGAGAMATILSVVIPAMLIMGMLKKATDFAKKGGGMFGELIMTGAKLVGGFALGAATGGIAMAGTATVGRLGAKIANSETAKRWEREGKFGSSLLRSGAKSMSSASFDMRGVKIAGKTLGSATGMGVGNARTGGFVERKKEQIAKRQKRAEELKMGENTEEKLKLDTAEEKLKRVKLQFEPDLEKFDKAIAAAREDLNDAKNSGDIMALEKAKKELADAKDGKKALREKMGEDGVSLKGAEEEVHHITYDIKVKNAKRIEEYAKLQESLGERAKGFVLSGGIYTKKEAREVAHKIRMEAKIEEVSGKKSHGGDDHAPASHPAPKPAAAKPAAASGGGHGGGGHGGH